MIHTKVKSCQAAILVEQNKPLIIDHINLPEKLLFGQILIKLDVSGICGSQIGEITGAKGEDKYLPHLLGHEGCGEVIQIGAGVKTLKEGDKVVLHWKKGSGIESEPPQYSWDSKTLNAGWVTTFNSYAVVSENRCTKIPKNTKSYIGSLLGCAITTGFGVIENNAKLKIGESIVIFGAGGIGLSMIQAALSVSAYPIIAVDIFDNRLKLARKIGATHTINTKNEDSFLALENILGKSNLDVFIDNTGKPMIIEKGFSLIKNNGRLILVGVPVKGENINIFSLPLHFGKVITGSHGGECKPDLDIPRYLKHINSNKIEMDSLISKKYKLEDINQAVKAMSNGETAGRILITFK